MIRAKDCTEHLFNHKYLELLTYKRIKALRTSMFKNVNSYFHCCEFRCEIVLDSDRKKAQYYMFKQNLKRVNHYYYKLKNS